MTRSVVFLVVCLMALPTPPAAALQPVSVGSEFQVNTYTNARQGRPAIVVRQDGSFVVVWSGGAHDGSAGGVFAQSFGSAGSRVSEEFQVNVYTENTRQFPAATTDADGNLVVVWSSYGQDGSGTGTFARRFTSAGAALVPEFQVSVYTVYGEMYPDVTADGDGDFVVTWSSYLAGGGGVEVIARSFSSSGGALATEFVVNTSRMGDLSNRSRPFSLSTAWETPA